MRRLIAVAVAAALLIPVNAAGASGSPPELSAACAILVDGESGRVLFERNSRKECDIASITKLMTALVAVEHAASLEEEVTIRPEWVGIEGSSIYLQTGEMISLEALLYGLLLNSGNDAAVAIAAYCAGSVDTFVKWMNESAKGLGMEQTHFTNPNGLSEDEHYSTAYDMALLALACSKNETIAEIVSTKSVTFGTRTFTNHNKLLWRYEGCTGMKTGYTEKAGRTLVSSAERDGRTLVAVTFNAPNDWSDHASLFDYGFKEFPMQILCTADSGFRRLPVRGGLVPFVCAVTAENLRYPISNNEQIHAKIELYDSIEAPVERGAVLGNLSFYLEDELIAETDLIAEASVHREVRTPRTIWEQIQDLLSGND